MGMKHDAVKDKTKEVQTHRVGLLHLCSCLAALAGAYEQAAYESAAMNSEFYVAITTRTGTICSCFDQQNGEITYIPNYNLLRYEPSENIGFVSLV
jgi:hypothetical protein